MERCIQRQGKRLNSSSARSPAGRTARSWKRISSTTRWVSSARSACCKDVRGDTLPPGREAALSIPTSDPYVPLLYVVSNGRLTSNDELSHRSGKLPER